MMRVDDKQKFEYLLNRGILPSTCDVNGLNSLHYAIRFDKLPYLAYMVEGEY